MKYCEFRDYVLQLLNMYTARGSEFTERYNDQADFLARIPGLYNAAMLEIASVASPLVGVMQPDEEQVEDRGTYVAVKVPDDFMSMSGDGIPVLGRDGRMMRIKAYYMAGADTVMIRKDLYRHGTLEYYRTPLRLNIDYQAVEDEEVLDGTLEMQTAAAYYVAGMLMMQEDAFVYAALRNEYDDKLSQMKKRLRAEVFFVEDIITSDCYNVY
jgi:hypothetical protein